MASCRADLANLVNEAALLAGRQNKLVVEKVDFIKAVERSIAVSPSVFLLVCTYLSFWMSDCLAFAFLGVALKRGAFFFFLRFRMQHVLILTFVPAFSLVHILRVCFSYLHLFQR